MHSLFITYKDGNVLFYAYKYDNEKNDLVCTKLSDKDISVELAEMNHEKIIKVLETDKALTAVLENGRNIKIDTTEIFKQKSVYQSELIKFMQAINDFVSKKNCNDFKSKLPVGHIPRINRHKSKNMGKKIVAGGLAATLILGVSLAYQKQDKKERKTTSMPPEKTYELTTNLKYSYEKDNEIELAQLNESKDCVINLDLEYKEDGKLASTIDYCGDIISYYCSRYGIPYDPMCSLITQERPNITSDGVLKNPCQLTNFVGNTLTIPIYDEFGPTGEYDKFTVTEDMVNSLDWNIRIGVGYVRCCTNKYQSLISGFFAYNQGINALANACEYFDLDLNNYLGDENAIKARDLVNKYYQELKSKGVVKGVHGDPNYLENVFRYASVDDRENRCFDYYLGSEVKTVEINNTLEYNNDLGGR